MATNYVTGRNYEYKTIEELKAKGYDIVFRSAGSHSPIDIVAIDTVKKVVLFVQCKNHIPRKGDLKQLEDDFKSKSGMYLTGFALKTADIPMYIPTEDQDTKEVEYGNDI